MWLPNLEADLLFNYERVSLDLNIMLCYDFGEQAKWLSVLVEFKFGDLNAQHHKCTCIKFKLADFKFGDLRKIC